MYKSMYNNIYSFIYKNRSCVFISQKVIWQEKGSQVSS